MKFTFDRLDIQICVRGVYKFYIYVSQPGHMQMFINNYEVNVFATCIFIENWMRKMLSSDTRSEKHIKWNLSRYTGTKALVVDSLIASKLGKCLVQIVWDCFVFLLFLDQFICKGKKEVRYKKIIQNEPKFYELSVNEKLLFAPVWKMDLSLIYIPWM